MRIEGILFDFDGTLANTVDLIMAAFEHTFNICLGKSVPRADIAQTFGLPLAQAMERFAPSPAMVDEMRRVYREFNLEHHDEMIKSFPHVSEALAGLQARGIKMAVVTSKKTPMAYRGLQCCGLEAYISAVVGCDDTHKNKPHPEPMLVACAKLGVAPEQCICIGDSHFDLLSGRSAGALTAAVRYTSLDWQTVLREGKPDYVLNDMCELLDIVDELNACTKEDKNA